MHVTKFRNYEENIFFCFGKTFIFKGENKNYKNEYYKRKTHNNNNYSFKN